MTKEPTKADLLKTIKKQDAAVRKLTKALNFEKDKLEASQAVAAAYLRQLQNAGVVLQTERLGYKPPTGVDLSPQTTHSVSEWRRTNQGAHGKPIIEEWPFGHGDAPVMPWDYCLPNPYEDNK